MRVWNCLAASDLEYDTGRIHSARQDMEWFNKLYIWIISTILFENLEGHEPVTSALRLPFFAKKNLISESQKNTI
jgi:hypothetical protein